LIFGSNNLDIRLRGLIKGYSRDDPPPRRAKPIPVTYFLYAMELAYPANPPPNFQPDPAQAACADLLCIAFFFLMRPGEYCVSSEQPHPFRLEDVEFRLGYLTIPATNLSPEDALRLPAANMVTLTFSTQKNSVRGEKIGQNTSGHPKFCPVKALARRVLHLHEHDAPNATPIHNYFRGRRFFDTTSRRLTSFLRTAIAGVGPEHGVSPEEASTMNLRPSGATALLCSDVDTDLIRLMGRWHSDAMIRYLHVQVLPIVTRFASAMLTNGNYNFRHDPVDHAVNPELAPPVP
jgi:hypothetical protein